MTDLANGATGARERLTSDFHSLASHAEELMRTTASLSGSSVAAARDRLNESLTKVRDQLTGVERMAFDGGRQALTATQSYVRENPWQAVAIGVLVGLTLGVIATSSRRHASDRK
jgi:ElaB/YqjD/DUF883 family membrane-anchored ribosome-binding protein